MIEAIAIGANVLYWEKADKCRRVIANQFGYFWFLR